LVVFEIMASHDAVQLSTSSLLFVLLLVPGDERHLSPCAAY
jgi:hypothetical protein